MECLLGVFFGLGLPQLYDLWVSTKSLLVLYGLCLASWTLTCLGWEFRHSIPESLVVRIYHNLPPGAVAAVVAFLA